MSVHRPGEGVPYASRPENQPITLTRKTYRELMDRLKSLEQKVEELQGHTHGYRAPGPMRPVNSQTSEPHLKVKPQKDEPSK